MTVKKSLTGILLINLGTPTGASIKEVRIFLREFLSDARVIDLPYLQRWLLVNGAILPFRPRATAKAYQQIWTDQGSPLLTHSIKLSKELSLALGDNYRVALGMRYGQPSIQDAILQLLNQSCQKLWIIPLFPQYSSAATGSAIAKTLQILQKRNQFPGIEIVDSFYDHPAFIQAWQTVIDQNRPSFTPQMWLFSYHGLPVRQLQKGSDGYPGQCHASAHLISEKLGIKPGEYRVSFQSRLGSIPWIPPYTDQLLPELAQQGVKKLAVICPSFVADCLETLEEIGIRAKEQWLGLGGTHFSLLPSLNSHPAWVEALKTMICPPRMVSAICHTRA